jgi:hypothetical protein
MGTTTVFAQMDVIWLHENTYLHEAVTYMHTHRATEKLRRAHTYATTEGYPANYSPACPRLPYPQEWSDQTLQRKWYVCWLPPLTHTLRVDVSDLRKWLCYDILSWRLAVTIPGISLAWQNSRTESLCERQWLCKREVVASTLTLMNFSYIKCT